jgi:hypothetical protein
MKLAEKTHGTKANETIKDSTSGAKLRTHGSGGATQVMCIVVFFSQVSIVQQVSFGLSQYRRKSLSKACQFIELIRSVDKVSDDEWRIKRSRFIRIQGLRILTLENLAFLQTRTERMMILLALFLLGLDTVHMQSRCLCWLDPNTGQRELGTVVADVYT